MYERHGGFKVQNSRLPGGDAGTKKTLGIMVVLAREGARMVEVREAALDAVRMAGVRPHDYRGELEAVYRFVRDRVRFTRDPFDNETLQSPRYTLKTMSGDCDDRATLLAAMVRSIGIPADLRFRAVAANRRNPRAFSHVYVVASIGGRRVPLDPTFEGVRSGWEIPNPSRATEIPVWLTN